MDYLSQLENQSIYIIREGYSQFKKVAMLWSIGKDSTTLLWLMRKAFFGNIPFPIIHLDTGSKFKEMYEFRDKYAKEWNLNLIVAKNQEALDRGIRCSEDRALVCAIELKTNNLKKVMAKYGFKALYLAIRRDEHGIRAKERIFSPRNKYFSWDYRNQPPELWDYYKAQVKEREHFRIHPLLGWRELDIWEYIKREHIPVVPLYFAKNGERYRSLGCVPHTKPIDSHADTINKIIEELKTTKISERSGRTQDKESDYIMQKLRALGYM